MKRIVEFFVLVVLVSFGFTFCVKDDLPVPQELGTSIDIVFPPPPPPEVDGKLTDWDRNSYKIVEIGDQTWMAENLRTTRYNDGTLIPKATSYSEWIRLSTGGYCWYQNDEIKYRSDYGAIYKGYSVMTGKLCPTGWHVPDLSDWKVLITHLGGWEVAGGKLKESGTNHWELPNAGATNLSGFTALPGGRLALSYRIDAEYYCFCKYPYNSFGFYCEWWSSTADTYMEEALLILGLNYSQERVWGLDTPGEINPEQEYGRRILNGCYVRCIKDNK